MLFRSEPRTQDMQLLAEARASAGQVLSLNQQLSDLHEQVSKLNQVAVQYEPLKEAHAALQNEHAQNTRLLAAQDETLLLSKAAAAQALADREQERLLVEKLTAKDDELNAQLQAAQQKSLSATQQLAVREQDFAEKLAAKEREMTAQLQAAQQKSLSATQQLAVRERDFAEKLAAKERELTAQLQAAQQKSLIATQQLAVRERDFAEKLLAKENELGIQLVALRQESAHLSRALADSDAKIGALSQAASLNDGHISTLKGNIASLTELAAAREAHALSLNQAIAERDSQIAQISRIIAERDSRITELSEELDAIYRAISWRLTAPLRKMGSWLGLTSAYPKFVAGARQPLGHSLPSAFNDASLYPNEPLMANKMHNAHTHPVYQAQKAIPPANNLAELLQDHEIQFVVRTYRTLLKRPPDSQGLQYYLTRLLNGSPKIQILSEISESEEARGLGVRLPGLASAIKRYRLAHAPVAGTIARFFFNVEINSLGENRLRAIEQQLYANRRHLDSNFAELMSNQKDSPHVPLVEQISAKPQLLVENAIAERSQSLPVADGTWEWSQYEVVKERLQGVKSLRRDTVRPLPLKLIEIGNEPLSSAASRIILPAAGKAPDVSIILPVYNNLKLTLECLLSISKHTDPSVTYEVLVRDDASTDDTVKIVSSIKNVRLVRNPENLGFLRNCNRALDSVRGRYVLFLNNDVQVSEGWLATLLGTFEKYPKVGAVGPRFVYPSGHLQEAGAAFRPDGTADMIGLNEDPEQPRFSYARRVDYTSGACLMVPTGLVKELGGFSEEFLPCYCEDSDLCLRVQEKGFFVYCNPAVTIVHHLSKTTASINEEFKLRCIANNLNTLTSKWAHRFDKTTIPRVLAFYLPQFHPFPENNKWWGDGFTEWSNVTKAQPNFAGHYQPRLPADLGYYDLRLSEVMVQQAELARRSGIDGFCFYYYWFGGKRLLDGPIEQMLALKKPDFPFCLCWANENWTRRWDGQDSEILMAQAHSPKDDLGVIADLSRYFRDKRYIRVDGRPLILIYRVTLFPNFAETAARWRTYCREQGIGEIYIAMVESFELVHSRTHPSTYGCDAAVEFPPQELAEQKPPSGEITNPNFKGSVADFRDLAVKFATRDLPHYTRFMGVAPGWDNTARMQDKSFCFEQATPGAFQAWLEEAIEQTRAQHYGDERLIFVNAWNEWAEGAYLEPDRRFGHAFLEAVRNAKQAATLLRKDKYGLGG